MTQEQYGEVLMWVFQDYMLGFLSYLMLWVLFKALQRK